MFPSCWGGTSLTSDIFMSHVSYTEGGWGKYEMSDRQWRAYAAECPASHPVRIPEVQFYFRVATSISALNDTIPVRSSAIS